MLKAPIDEQVTTPRPVLRRQGYGGQDGHLSSAVAEAMADKREGISGAPVLNPLYQEGWHEVTGCV